MEIMFTNDMVLQAYKDMFKATIDSLRPLRIALKGVQAVHPSAYTLRSLLAVARHLRVARDMLDDSASEISNDHVRDNYVNHMSKQLRAAQTTWSNTYFTDQVAGMTQWKLAVHTQRVASAAV